MATPVSLVDVYPTVRQSFGLPEDAGETDLPGRSLFDFIDSEDPERSVLSEYHALATKHGISMIRHQSYKYVHYEDASPQLFNLETDPQEIRSLADDPLYADLRTDMDHRLRRLVDPADADTRARADQERRVEELGGREALIRRGAFDNSPVPGEKPKFHL